MIRIVAVVLLQLCLVCNVFSAEILHASVQYTEGVYTVEFNVLVSAEAPKIYDLLTDYANLHDLNDSIIKSEVIDEQSDTVKKCRLLLHTCILFFCRDVVMAENVQTERPGTIIATIDPAQSDFRSGQSKWVIVPAGAGLTNISLHRSLAPAFWIPPIIGPWLVKKKLLEELSVMLNRLELYANR